MEKEIPIREQILTLQIQELNETIEARDQEIRNLKRDNKDLEEGYDELVKKMDFRMKQVRELQAAAKGS